MGRELQESREGEEVERRRGEKGAKSQSKKGQKNGQVKGGGSENSWKETERCRKRELQRERGRDRDRRGVHTGGRLEAEEDGDRLEGHRKMETEAEGRKEVWDCPLCSPVSPGPQAHPPGTPFSTSILSLPISTHSLGHMFSDQLGSISPFRVLSAPMEKLSEPPEVPGHFIRALCILCAHHRVR